MNGLTKSAHQLWQKHEQLLKFLIAGSYNTVFGLSAFAGLYLLFSDRFHYIAIAIAANALGITSAFFVYRYWVFKSTGPIIAEYFKMYAVYAVSFTVNLILLALLVELAGLHPIAAQFVAAFVTVTVSYLGHQKFTFNQGAKSAQTPPDN